MKKNIWVRNEFTTRGSDPTQTVNWAKRFGPIGGINVKLTEFFGDVTARVSYRGHELFTSDCIHPILNKLATWQYNKLENAYQEAEYADCFEDGYPPQSYWE